uniref:Zmiz1_N domain-containing protein n=1 Tax=Angiostrongylus cantonensis TaxID=6313 RepID=A0A0K0D7G1_ANGCA
LLTTNSRLKFQSLMEENSFPSACTELTQWCADQRAFSSYFEENLLAALQVLLPTSSASVVTATRIYQIFAYFTFYLSYLVVLSASSFTLKVPKASVVLSLANISSSLWLYFKY